MQKYFGYPTVGSASCEVPTSTRFFRTLQYQPFNVSRQKLLRIGDRSHRRHQCHRADFRLCVCLRLRADQRSCPHLSGSGVGHYDVQLLNANITGKPNPGGGTTSSGTIAVGSWAELNAAPGSGTAFARDNRTPFSAIF